MNRSSRNKDTNPGVQFHGVAQLGKEFLEESGFLDGAFDSDYVGFDSRIVTSVADVSFVEFELRERWDKEVPVGHRIGVKLLLGGVEFTSEGRVENDLTKFVDHNRFEVRAARETRVEFGEVSDRRSLLDTERIGFNEDFFFCQPVNELRRFSGVEFDVSDGPLAGKVASNDDVLLIPCLTRVVRNSKIFLKCFFVGR